MPHSFALPRLPIFEALTKHDPGSTAIVHYPSGRKFTYGELVHDVADATAELRTKTKRSQTDLVGERIAFLVENGYDYVVTLLSIFANHAVAVPLCTTFPNHELRYIIDNAEALLLLSSEKFKDKATDIIASDDEHEIRHKPLVDVEKIKQGDKSVQSIVLEDVQNGASERGGLMLYTSGTTNRPKGVLLPQDVLTAQCRSLLEAWMYTSKDRVLHVLPLHHIHGTVNALLTPLYAGATIEFMFPFNAQQVWQRLAAPFLTLSTANSQAFRNGHSVTNGHTVSNGDSVAKETPTPDGVPSTNGTRVTNGHSVNGKHTTTNGHAAPNGDLGTNAQTYTNWSEPITFFTVVPTIYNRLLGSHGQLTPELREATRTAISPPNLRLNISGSAALPTPTRMAWEALSHGNVLLERYGMTEVGMALSCGLDFRDRVDGSVGWPLPSVEARLVDTETGEVIEPGSELDAAGKERQGEIQLRGPTIFREYWRNPKATVSEFTGDEGGKGRWFKTGDVAVRRAVQGAGEGRSGRWATGPMYFIQGRKSADIIKTGGEKVSALEVEREMLSLPQIAECAVVALPSDAWGQKVAAVVILTEEGKTGGRGGKPYGPMDLRRALKERIANYKIPQEMRLLDAMPRNAMGKVNKKQLVLDVFGDQLETK